MAYFKINGLDFSACVNELRVKRAFNYNAQTNAAGNTVVDLINAKRQIEVGTIPLDGAQAASLLDEVQRFNVLISYHDPVTGALVDNVHCIIPDTDIDYYMINEKRVLLNEFKLKFTEL